MLDHCTIRELKEEDLPKVLNWRNHPKVRSFMLTQHEISFEEHSHWFHKVKKEKKHHLFIVEEVGQSIGFVQFNIRSHRRRLGLTTDFPYAPVMIVHRDRHGLFGLFLTHDILIQKSLDGPGIKLLRTRLATVGLSIFGFCHRIRW